MNFDIEVIKENKNEYNPNKVLDKRIERVLEMTNLKSTNYLEPLCDIAESVILNTKEYSLEEQQNYHCFDWVDPLNIDDALKIYAKTLDKVDYKGYLKELDMKFDIENPENSISSVLDRHFQDSLMSHYDELNEININKNIENDFKTFYFAENLGKPSAINVSFMDGEQSILDISLSNKDIDKLWDDNMSFEENFNRIFNGVIANEFNNPEQEYENLDNKKKMKM